MNVNPIVVPIAMLIVSVAVLVYIDMKAAAKRAYTSRRHARPDYTTTNTTTRSTTRTMKRESIQNAYVSGALRGVFIQSGCTAPDQPTIDDILAGAVTYSLLQESRNDPAYLDRAYYAGIYHV